MIMSISTGRRQCGQRFIPIEVVADILSWLPVKPINRFKCVSPEWHALIRSQAFINLHLRRGVRFDHIFMTAVVERKTKNPLKPFQTGYMKAKLYSLNLSPIVVDGQRKEAGNTATNLLLNRIHVTLQGDFHVMPIGSCNGIVCLRNVDGWGFTLLNPSNRTHIKVTSIVEDKRAVLFAPIPNQNQNQQVTELELMSFGFGYDSVADDYKVVKVTQIRKVINNAYVKEAMYRTKVNVYSWKNKRWDMYWDKFYGIYAMQYSSVYDTGVPYNNALYWLAIRHSPGQADNVDGELVIVSFDVCTQKFRRDTMSPPKYTRYVSQATYLSEVKQCVHFMVTSSKGGSPGQVMELEMWKMKDDTSWCRICTIEIFPYLNTRIINYSQRHNNLLSHTQGGMKGNLLLLGDPVTGETRATYQFYCADQYPRIQPYVESLVDLNFNPK